MPDKAELAREAFDRAQAEVAAGNAGAARRWLDRACRVAPQDQTLKLALATSCLAQDDRRAGELFASVCAASDVREAWLGLATARRRLGDAPGAAAALAAALARHVPDRRLAALADAIAREAGVPGWCGLSGDGRVTVRPGAIAGRVGIALDGRPVARAGARLARWLGGRSLSVTTADGTHLLGSPIDVHAIARTVGCVACRDGGLEGWAWHPGDPDTDPVITIRPVAGRGQIRLTASDTIGQLDANGLLARPRGFHLPARSWRAWGRCMCSDAMAATCLAARSTRVPSSAVRWRRRRRLRGCMRRRELAAVPLRWLCRPPYRPTRSAGSRPAGYRRAGRRWISSCRCMAAARRCWPVWTAC